MRKLRCASILVALATAVACFGGDAVSEIRLAADGSLTLDGEPVTLEELADAPALENDDRPVRVLVDDAVAYRHVAELQGVLRQLDLDEVTFEPFTATATER